MVQTYTFEEFVLKQSMQTRSEMLQMLAPLGRYLYSTVFQCFKYFIYKVFN